MILAELSRGVPERLEDLATVDLRAAARSSAGQLDLRRPGAEGPLPGHKGCASGGAALLAVLIGEHRAFLGDAIDVRGLKPISPRL